MSEFSYLCLSDHVTYKYEVSSSNTHKTFKFQVSIVKCSCIYIPIQFLGPPLNGMYINGCLLTFSIFRKRFGLNVSESGYNSSWRCTK